MSTFDPTVVLPQCEPAQTGTRNQDIFSARFDSGLLAGALGNTKTLGSVQRGFALVIQNTTTQTRSYRLTILDQPVGGHASFRQFEPLLTVLDVSIPRLSSVARTVYVSSSDPTARVTIDVAEISAPGAPAPLDGGLHSAIVINGDASNPAIENPAIENPAIENKDIQSVEVYNPRINPAIENPAIENPAIENPAIENPAIENVTVANQGIINPAIENPAIENPAIENPAIENPAIENVTLANGSISDTTWQLTNDGNTAAVYAVKLLLNQAVPNGILTQLIIHKPYTTPAATPNCELKVQLHNNILVNITTPAFAVQNPATPAIENPAIENPAIENPAIENATVALAPGETAFVTVRAFDPDKTDTITFSPAAAVTPAAVAQSVNTDDITRASRRRRPAGRRVDDHCRAGVGRRDLPERQLRSATVCERAGHLVDRRRRLADRREPVADGPVLGRANDAWRLQLHRAVHVRRHAAADRAAQLHRAHRRAAGHRHDRSARTRVTSFAYAAR